MTDKQIVFKPVFYIINYFNWKHTLGKYSFGIFKLVRKRFI